MYCRVCFAARWQGYTANNPLQNLRWILQEAFRRLSGDDVTENLIDMCKTGVHPRFVCIGMHRDALQRGKRMQTHAIAAKRNAPAAKFALHRMHFVYRRDHEAISSGKTHASSLRSAECNSLGRVFLLVVTGPRRIQMRSDRRAQQQLRIPHMRPCKSVHERTGVLRNASQPIVGNPTRPLVHREPRENWSAVEHQIR